MRRCSLIVYTIVIWGGWTWVEYTVHALTHTNDDKHLREGKVAESQRDLMKCRLSNAKFHRRIVDENVKSTKERQMRPNKAHKSHPLNSFCTWMLANSISNTLCVYAVVHRSSLSSHSLHFDFFQPINLSRSTSIIKPSDEFNWKILRWNCILVKISKSQTTQKEMIECSG